jgi:hypothetical protein
MDIHSYHTQRIQDKLVRIDPNETLQPCIDILNG